MHHAKKSTAPTLVLNIIKNMENIYLGKTYREFKFVIVIFHFGNSGLGDSGGRELNR